MREESQNLKQLLEARHVNAHQGLKPGDLA
jgi:hypothetical protein